MKDKHILFLITIILDIYLLLVLCTQNNNNHDCLFIYLSLIVHFFFYIGLIYENIIILDISHIFVFLLPLISIFILNKQIKCSILGLLLTIQILWIIKGKCILHSLPTNFINFGYGNTIQVFTIIICLILVYQVLYN